MQDGRDHFDSLGKGVIVADLGSCTVRVGSTANAAFIGARTVKGPQSVEDAPVMPSAPHDQRGDIGDCGI